MREREYSVPFFLGDTMKKNLLVLTFAIAALFASLYYYNAHTESQKLYNTQEVTEIIEDTYNDVSGFSIDTPERQLIENQGGNPTYGEITIEAVSEILNDVPLTSRDLFFDLGAGVGKVCVQVALATPARAVGVELSPTRYQGAQKIKDELLKRNILTDASKLQFIEQNIVDTYVSNATVIFLCSTCFSDELMRTLTNKMAHECKSGLRVITLKELVPHDQFTLVKTYELPMSWSQSSSVYLYKLIK